jgi:hypothetical protein
VPGPSTLVPVLEEVLEARDRPGQTKGSDAVATPFGNAGTGSALRQSVENFRDIFGKASAGEEAADIPSRLRGLAEMRNQIKATDFEPSEPQGFFQKSAVRISRALDPDFDRKRKMQALQAKASMLSQNSQLAGQLLREQRLSNPGESALETGLADNLVAINKGDELRQQRINHAQQSLDFLVSSGEITDDEAKTYMRLHLMKEDLNLDPGEFSREAVAQKQLEQVKTMTNLAEWNVPEGALPESMREDYATVQTNVAKTKKTDAEEKIRLKRMESILLSAPETMKATFQLSKQMYDTHIANIERLEEAVRFSISNPTGLMNGMGTNMQITGYAFALGFNEETDFNEIGVDEVVAAAKEFQKTIPKRKDPSFFNEIAMNSVLDMRQKLGINDPTLEIDTGGKEPTAQLKIDADADGEITPKEEEAFREALMKRLADQKSAREANKESK